MEQFKTNLDEQLQKEMKQKQFLKAIFEPNMEYGNKLQIGNNLKNNEQIILCFLDKRTNYMVEKSFNNIDDLILYLRSNNKKEYCETYFSIYSSANGKRKTVDMKTATCIALDFDKKNFVNVVHFDLIDYIQKQFQKLHLFYNAIVDTGNGYHVYIMIEPTTNIELVTKVTRQIAELVNADKNACKPTQILRIPFTWNNKQINEGIRKPVTLYYLDKYIKRKNINVIANRLFKVNDSYKENKTIKTFNGTTCQKIEDLTTEQCTNRHENLLWLYGQLKFFKNTEAQIQVKLEQFQALNQLEDWNYQINYLQEYEAYGCCSGCKYKKECNMYELFKEASESDILFNNSTLKNASKNKKEGAKENMLTGNELLIYGLIYIQENVTKEKLIQELTYNKNVAMSDRTLKTCLKSLENKNLITVEKQGKYNIYSLKEYSRVLEDEQIFISSAMLYERIKGHITNAEFQLYCFMKYLQWEQHYIKHETRSNFKLKITQTELAKRYGISRQKCNELVNSLIEKPSETDLDELEKTIKHFEREKYISICEVHTSKKNGYDYYTYTLNY